MEKENILVSVRLEHRRTEYCKTEHSIEMMLALQSFRNIVSAEVAQVEAICKFCPEVCLHAELNWLHPKK